MKNCNVLIVNSDLTSNGGIASVIKTYYNIYKTGNYPFNLYLLKTCYYKDKTLLFEFFILFTSIINYFKFLLFKQVKLVHIHSSAGVSFFRKSVFVIIGKLFNKRILFHIHASRFYDFFIQNNRFIKMYINFILINCDEIIVLCYDWEEKLKIHYPNIKVVVIANPISLEKNRQIKLIAKSDIFKILFVGFLIESKGIRDLMEVARKIKHDNFSDIIIQIAGKGDLEPFIIEYIEKEHLHNVVDYLGWISGKEKELIYLNSDVFVLPSYKEGMPISILEAMSYGLPVISTKISGIPELISENINGYLFSPGDVDTLYEKIIYLKSDQTKIEEMSTQNLIKVGEFSAENIFQKVVGKYYEYL